MEQQQWDRCAEVYHEEVVSPFTKGVENPLFAEIKKIKHKSEKNVAEFGCGFFNLGETLAKSFKDVYASDFSSKMIKIAKEKNGHHYNVSIIQEDLRTMQHQNKFDVVISVNSLLMPSSVDIRKALSNIYSSIKPYGDIFLIVPSMEAVLYHGLLLFEKELNNKPESVAKRVAKIKFEKKKYDLFLGHYKDGKDVQKLFYKHEIKFLLQKAGFNDISFDKVKYPWRKDVSSYEDFPNEEPMWDWFVKAKK
ncbi:MAG: class I SAM-dependent methyltransferase [Candidatus Woesearchaeota archaeon]